MGNSSLRTTILLLFAAVVLGAPGRAEAARPGDPALAQQPAAPARSVFLDVNGAPLPFATDEELLDYLRTAEVVAHKEISNGITLPQKLTLEKNGIRAHAVFRRLDEEKPVADFGSGERELFFRDSYLFEPAAYELGRLLGMDSIPPATLRDVNSVNGSVQIWVEKAQTEEQRVKNKLAAPDPHRWARQRQLMFLFDALIDNTDRTRNNILITPDWKIWLIDHTRAFRRAPALRDENQLQSCDRDFYRRLKALDEKTVRERLKPYLRGPEITAIMKRRDLLVRHLDKLIAERGENAVLSAPPAEE